MGEFNSKTQAVPMSHLTQDETDPVAVVNTAIREGNALVVINKAYNDPIFEWRCYKKIAETNHYVIYQRFLE